MKRTYILGVAGLLLIAIVAVVVITGKDTAQSTNTKSSQQSAQLIPEGTYFKEVKRLSAGKKPACLTPDPALAPIAKADDELPFEKSTSVALGTVIPDMPAGLTDVKFHDYSVTKASGYEVFSDKNQQSLVGNLKSFNFTIERANAESSWKLKTFIACTE